jgi:hypothetical protein
MWRNEDQRSRIVTLNATREGNHHPLLLRIIAMDGQHEFEMDSIRVITDLLT